MVAVHGGGVNLGNMTVLLVDDDGLIRNIGRDAMTALGYPVVTASNGAEALEAATHEPGLVILDDHLPDMAGLAVLQALRARWPAVPIVLSTGSDRAHPTQRVEEGWTAVLAKPYTITELADLLALFLGPPA